jgi:MADS-box transcription factor
MMTQQWPSQDINSHGGDFLNVRQEMAARSASIDVGTAMRIREYGVLQAGGYAQSGQGMRTVSVSAAQGYGHMRNNSLQNDLKRPRLTVQIPGEQAEAASAAAPAQASGTTESAESSAQGSGSGSATAGAGTRTGFTRPRGASNNFVLPPPSPSVKSPSSAGGLLSAGASGPKNPFARPPPPQSGNPGSATQQNFPYRENETPLSALPSRFMSGDILPSPSQFYGDWGFGHTNLVSPATYQPTPIASQGPSWRDEEKRRSEDSNR